MAEAPRIGLVVKGYPRLSETFIAQEIHGLERRGLALEIISLRRPHDGAIHPIHKEIQAPVRYLPEYLYQEPWRVFAAWQKARRLPAYRRVFRLWLKDFLRDPTANRGRRFGQALVLAAELSPAIDLLYIHYLHTPASVGRYAALLKGLPFCLSAHAKDIWTSPAWEIKEKLADCRWLTTCTATNHHHLSDLAPDTLILLTYHGLDVLRFPARARKAGSDGRHHERPVRLLGVARLVAKKGLDVLLEALARLPRTLHWRYDHIGGGDLRHELEAKARDLGLFDRITWRGPAAQEEVIAAYRAADLFVLASRIAPDGDRDGLPNVLLEAGSQELCLLSTEVSAVPELIVDGVNGRLVPPDDPASLASALEDLIAAPAIRVCLGQAARQTVLARFAMEPGLDDLASRLRDELAGRLRSAA